MSATGFIAQDVPALRRGIKEWNDSPAGRDYRLFTADTGLWLGQQDYMIRCFLNATTKDRSPDPIMFLDGKTKRQTYMMACDWWVKTSFDRMLGDGSVSYYVNEETMAVAQAAAERLPADFHFTSEDFPSECGFMVFASHDPHPTELTELNDEREALPGPLYFSAVSWSPNIESPDTRFVEWWISRKDAIAAAIRVNKDPGPIYRATTAPLLCDIESHIQIDAPVDPQRTSINHIRLLYTLLQLMRERTIAVETQPVQRAERKRAKRAGVDPEVRVIRLRNRREVASPEECRTVDWSCRWVVDAHWRKQPYGPRNGPKVIRPKLIMPYVKGPADKPLRETPKVKVL